ncbi:MAG TPA: NUDIX domain-containing protein [Verrucomicrobiae bacterium]|nr:NUDIX domain-containing protein [Verrucomicrobiae bacterium]
MTKPLVYVVDEHDTVIGTKSREDLKPKDILRVSVLWIENGRGQVLLQQRALTKKLGPGLWGPAVAGTVESHETYLSNVIKETEEEIGVVGIKPEEVGKRLYWEPGGNFGRMFTFFKAGIDKPLSDFTIQEDEVAQIKWVAKDAILTDTRKSPKNYVPSVVLWEEMYY